MLLTSTLRMLGHSVEHCATAEAGLERLEHDDFRIVVSDWKMPTMDGLALCRAVRERSRAYVYFILVSTQRITKENRRLALAAGVDDFLTKPIDQDEIGMRLHVAERIVRLTEQLTQMAGFIPVCRSCHGARIDSDFWEQVEVLVHRHRTEDSTLDVCSDCRTRPG